MSAIQNMKVALVGNPNSGKSTLFNALTGLNQKTGNFPGVTVDKKSGFSKLNNLVSAEFIDLPGTYSLYPKSLDEQVTVEVLCNLDNPDHPDVTIVVADATNLKRNLFLVSQIIDLKKPMILVLNMMDLVEKEGDVIDTVRLSEKIGVKVIGVSARNKEGIEQLKQLLLQDLPIPQYDFINIKNLDSQLDKNKFQSQESVERYKVINRIVEECITQKSEVKPQSFTNKLDNILTHRIWGYAIFLTILFFIFQTIFFLAAFPMNWIEVLFVWFSDMATQMLPEGEVTNLLVNGILAGLSGIVVFVPQIALLFAFIAKHRDINAINTHVSPHGSDSGFNEMYVGAAA